MKTLPPELTFQLARGLVTGLKQRKHTPQDALDILFVAVQLALADSEIDKRGALDVYDAMAGATRVAIVKIFDAPPGIDGQPQS